MSDCVFCKMVTGEIAPDKLYEDEDILAFRDLNPQAPLHALIIPKRHIATTNDLEDTDADLLGRLTLVAKRLAAEAGVAESGYRTVLNCNAGAGQSVFHLHLHLLGGRRLGWPPG
ncbi:MAG: histidine triad nucleotide-binding protein [Gammaproteobacteria bacterium]